jgi:hypothetical protein
MRYILLGYIFVILLLYSLDLVDRHIVHDTLAKISKKPKVGPFVVYENPIYGVSIQYPDNWHKSENNLPSHGVVKFSAPDVKEKESKHSISIFIPAFLVVAVEDLPSMDVKLDQYVTDYLSKGFHNPTDYKILNSTQSTIAGNPAKRVILYDYSGGHTYEEMRVITLVNGTSYRVGLFGEPGMFSDYVPIAQSMIDSFQITK